MLLKSIKAFSILVLFFGGCDGMKTKESAVINVANKKVIELGYSPDELEIIASNEGNIWTVNYGPKGKNVIGGGPKVRIDSNSMEVIDYSFTQ